MDKKLIKQVILEQKQEIQQLKKEKLIEREIEGQVKKALDDKLIKIIIGVRRCGKSVLAHRILQNKDYGYINFDDERLIGAESKNLNDFLEVLNQTDSNAKYLLLDEIQNVEGWELFVNRLKRNGYNVIITGSNSKLLSQELSSHLTGRHFTIELYPFSFKEFLNYKDFSYTPDELLLTRNKAQIKNLLNDYLSFGGFPELFKITQANQYLRELFDKIISRDVVARYKIKYIKTFKELALYLLTNFSSKISYTKLKKIFEFRSLHTIKNYISYLEEAYILFQLYPFSFKLKEQIKANKKIYGIDTGLIKSVSHQFSSNSGRMIENVVFVELKRKKQDFYFYSDNLGREVDFVIKKNNKANQLIQVCFDLQNLETKDRELKSLIKISKELKCNNLLVISDDYESEEKYKNKKIVFVPLWKWLLK